MPPATSEPPGPAEIAAYYAKYADRARDFGAPDRTGVILELAKKWTVGYMRSTAGQRDWLADPEQDFVRPFVLLAALKFGVGREAWADFLKRTAAAVDSAAKDPELCYLRPLDEDDFHPELRQYLSNTLRDAETEVPSLRWLWQAYLGAFTLFKRARPRIPPHWWNKVLGPPFPPLRPDEPPGPSPSPSPPSFLPDDETPKAFLPDDEALEAFLVEEAQGHPSLEAILREQGGKHVPVYLEDNAITALQFLYLRYRNSPAAGSDDPPTPRANDLADLLDQHSYRTDRGIQVTGDYVNTLLSRVRDDVEDRVVAAISAGDLPVTPAWVKRALPRPSLYIDGSLFPPL